MFACVITETADDETSIRAAGATAASTAAAAEVLGQQPVSVCVVPVSLALLWRCKMRL